MGHRIFLLVTDFSLVGAGFFYWVAAGDLMGPEFFYRVAGFF
jgi:hypothetical protein